MFSKVIVFVAVFGIALASLESVNYAPQPYKFGYNIKDKQGEQYREEEGNGAGGVKGSYGFTDERGIRRRVDYVADKDGFRAQVKTNEPGTANQDPAAVKMISDASNAEGVVLGRGYEGLGYGVNGYGNGNLGGLGYGVNGYGNGNLGGLGYGVNGYGNGNLGGLGYGVNGLGNGNLGEMGYGVNGLGNGNMGGLGDGGYGSGGNRGELGYGVNGLGYLGGLGYGVNGLGDGDSRGLKYGRYGLGIGGMGGLGFGLGGPFAGLGYNRYGF